MTVFTQFWRDLGDKFRFGVTVIQFVKYLFVGGINFLFGLITFYIFLHIMQLNYLVAFTISWALGILLTYVINFIWIFKPTEKLVFRARLVKYVVVYLASYTINVVILKVLTDYTGSDPFYLQFGIIPIVMIVNFLGMKYWSLRSTMESN
ncbi:MAG: GtrA family protein [Cyclobacteriaceae bacterium]